MKDFKIRDVQIACAERFAPLKEGDAGHKMYIRMLKTGKHIDVITLPFKWHGPYGPEPNVLANPKYDPLVIFRPSDRFAATFGGKSGVCYVLRDSVFYQRLTRGDIHAPESVSGLGYNKDGKTTWFVISAENLNEHKEKALITDKFAKHI